MAKQNEHERALELRKRGESIGSIARKLRVSKSTASTWCRDIALSEKQLRSIAEKSKHHATLSLLKASEVQRKKRQTDIANATLRGKEEVGSLSTRDIHMVGLGLYWGEGYKKGSQEMGFTNTDPLMIKFYIEWLYQIYGVKKTDLILRVSVNANHAHRVQKIVRYWSSITGVSSTQFTKTSLIKATSKKIYPNLEEHQGTLRVKVRRGTELRRRVLGSIAALTIR